METYEPSSILINQNVPTSLVVRTMVYEQSVFLVPHSNFSIADWARATRNKLVAELSLPENIAQVMFCQAVAELQKSGLLIQLEPIDEKMARAISRDRAFDIFQKNWVVLLELSQKVMNIAIQLDKKTISLLTSGLSIELIRMEAHGDSRLIPRVISDVVNDIGALRDGNCDHSGEVVELLQDAVEISKRMVEYQEQIKNTTQPISVHV